MILKKELILSKKTFSMVNIIRLILINIVSSIIFWGALSSKAMQVAQVTGWVIRTYVRACLKVP